MSNPRLYQLNTQTGPLTLTATGTALNVVNNAIFSSNVGIGTTNPTNTYGPTLHIRGDNPNLRLEGTGTGSWAWISMNNADAAENRAMGMGADGSFRITNIRDNLDSNVQFTILQGGNVGIGTTNPQSNMHLVGAAGQILRIQSTATNGGGFGWVGFYDGGGRKAYIGSGGNSNTFFFNIDTSDGDYIFANSTAYMITVKNSGYVGVGTTNPSVKLHIHGGTEEGGLILAGRSDWTTGVGEYAVGRITGRNIGAGVNTTQIKLDGDNLTGSMSFWTASSATLGMRMVINGAGNVGINTATPGRTLHVYGNYIRLEGIGESSLEMPLGGNTAYVSHGGWSIGGGKVGIGDGAFPTIVMDNVNDRVGILTASPATKLHIYHPRLASFTTQTRNNLYLESEGYNDSGFNTIDFGSNSYGVPLARIGVEIRGSGTFMSFGTSNSYATGITNRALTVNPEGNIGIGNSAPDFRAIIQSDITMNTDITPGTAQLSIQGNSDVRKRMILGYDTNGNGFGFIKAGFFNQTWTSLSLQPQGGNVGIGTTNPLEKLHVHGNIRTRNFTAGYIALSGDLSGYAAGEYPVLKTDGACLYFDAGGTYTGYICNTTGFVDVSDARFKTNITPFTNGLDIIMGLQGVNYAWADGRDDFKGHVGFIAQQVREVFPEAVADPHPHGLDEDGPTPPALGISSPPIVAALVEAVKELKAQNDALKSRIEALEAQ